jgi:hypothetical protein
MKIIFLIIIFIFINSNSFTAERSELEIKNKVFLEDIEEFGKFEPIDLAPNGMFENKYNQFVKMHQYSQKKLGLIFVKQKGLMDKYPENLMLGMGYFEFFYMAQLEENLKDIEKYQRDYPDVKNYTRKAVQKVYGLNKARKSMREALGFDLNDDVQDVLKTYFVLSKLFAKGEKITNTLSREEKQNYKSHKKLSENIGKIRSLVEEKSEQRIEEKKFNKEYKKLSKKIKDDLEKLSSLESYKVFRDFINELNEIQNPSIDDLLSSYKIANFLIGPIKEREIKKKYEVNLVNADFSDFSQDELKLLGESSKASKNNKVLKSNEIQKELFKIKNNNFIDVNSVIDKLKSESINLSSLNLKLDNFEKMTLWARKDWANAWQNPIPKKIDDKVQGIMIDLSEEDVESIKAQLAIDHFNSLFNQDFIQNFSDDLKQIQNAVTQNDFNFSYGLDDYAKFLGDVFNMDINNYADLTDLANATYNANWSVEEYASAYQLNVDAINALASGTSAFDVGQMAASLGASLQDVADTIAAASAAGVSVDLEAAAQGLGYDSFASAVDAYNAEHGTSYSVEEAREELGQ